MPVKGPSIIIFFNSTKAPSRYIPVSTFPSNLNPWILLLPLIILIQHEFII